MEANKTKPTKISVKTFIDLVPDQTRRSDAKMLVRLMQKATGEKPRMWGPSIIGFGTYQYRYDSGREGNMPIVGFSPRKSATVLYNLKAGKNHELLVPKLGKHTAGKGCIYIRRLADVDQTILETLIVNSVAAMRIRTPGTK